MRGIHRSSVNSPHKGQFRGALMFSFAYARINSWVNNGKAGDLRRHRAHYTVIVMRCKSWSTTVTTCNNSTNFTSPPPTPLNGECKPPQTYRPRLLHSTGEWSDLAQRLWSNKICISVPDGNFRTARWVNNHAIAYLWARTVLRALTIANRSSGCGLTASTKIWVPDGNSIKPWPYHCTSMG